MVVIETSVFTRRIQELLSDAEYALFQAALVANPELGDVIPGTNGLRKVRWGIRGRGKRGGIRVIYHWLQKRHELFLLLAYAKNEQDDLTPQQKKILCKLVEQEIGNGSKTFSRP